MAIKEVNVRNYILLEANKKPHCLQKFLSTKGKRRGKPRELSRCRYCVKIQVCKEYAYNIPVFEEFTDQQEKEIRSVSQIPDTSYILFHFVFTGKDKYKLAKSDLQLVQKKENCILSWSAQNRKCLDHLKNKLLSVLLL